MLYITTLFVSIIYASRFIDLTGHCDDTSYINNAHKGKQMSEMSFSVYPNLVAALGGPTHARTNGRSVWVHFHDRVIRMPFSKAHIYMNDGIELGEQARVWAYRNN